MDVKQGKKLPVKGKKRKPAHEYEHTEDLEGIPGSATTSSTNEENYRDLETSIQPASLAPFLRKFDVRVCDSFVI